jgi:glucan phosphoethanolaminetransferase (alkaline phosphatase superfamily)
MVELDPKPGSAKLLSGRYAALVIGALLLTIVPNVILLVTADHSFFWIAQTVTSGLIVLSPLLFGWRPRTALLILSPFAVFMPFAAAYAFATGFPPSLMAMQVLREATKEELSNFAPYLLIAAGIGLAIMLTFWRIAWKCGSSKLYLPWWIRLPGLLMLAVALGKDVVAHGLRTGSDVLLSRLEKIHPLAPLAIEVRTLTSGAAVPDRSFILSQYTVRQEPSLAQPEVCVLVIGESARKSAWTLYNPSLATTPRLLARNLVVFADAAAAATVTFQSVPIMLTGHMPANGEMLPYRSLGLVDAFRIAGFKTAWFSTQQADGEINSLVTAFTVNAEQTAYLNGRMDRSKYRRVEMKDDSALLEPFGQLLATTPGKLFVVLHMLGSHAPYLPRYPEKFEKWPVDPAMKSAIWHWLPPYSEYQRVQIDHTYLNSIHYTDWVLDQVIGILEKSGRISSLIYLSDHGENDAGAKLMPAAHAVPTKDVIEIPFFIWLSPAFRETRPDITAQLARHVTEHVSELDVFSTVCDLHSLQTSESDPSRSLARDTYHEHDRPVVLMDGSIIRYRGSDSSR